MASVPFLSTRGLCGAVPRSPVSRNQPPTIATAPRGALTKKIQCQLSAWVSTPPRTRPTEAPLAPVKL